jgi:CubicO group peptidase (beta-lactamase class C family)
MGCPFKLGWYCIAAIVGISFGLGACSSSSSAPPVRWLPAKSIPLDDFALVNDLSDLPEMKGIDSQVVRMMRQLEIVGASLAIAKDGRLVYAKGYGYADKEKQIKMQPYHLLRIASVSKLVTAVGIMKLVEQGKLKLSDKVFGKNGLLNDPDLLKINDKRMEEIEVVHLLTHAGGWRNRFRADPLFRTLEIAQWMKTKPPADIRTVIRFMLTQEMIAEPGVFYDYSNFGYCVLGEVIKKVTGMPYEKYIQTQVLQPLGIHRMQIGHSRLAQHAPVEVKYYDYQGARLKLGIEGKGDSVSRVDGGTHIEALGPSGGWIATPADLLKLVLAVDGLPGKPDMLQAETIETMIGNAAQTDSSKTKIIGWRAADKDRWWRTGSLAGTGIVVMRQNDGISWVLVTNTGTWKEARFSFDIMAAMDRGIRSVKYWTKQDLFEWMKRFQTN